MKTKALYSLASAILLAMAFTSCTDETQEVVNEQSQVLKQIVMTTQDFELEIDSRTLFDITDEATKSTWAANDTVGVFPDEGGQVYFPMSLGAGTKNAMFNGGGWALKDGSTYAAYYPCVGKFYLDRNAVPVSYAGQTQVGDASTSHLGAYDYMVATPTAPEFGSAHFMFKHLSALVQLKITVPQPATLNSVKLVTDTEVFAVKGSVDIMADAPCIKPVDFAKEIVLNLQDVATTEENQVVTFYMMLPPVDLTSQTLKAVVVTEEGVEEIALEARNFQAGIAYGLSGTLDNANGTYADGVVTMGKAGLMRQLLGNDYLNITSLKIVGPINGDDVYYLRKMSGYSELSETDRGKLITLDLSEASVVEGGEWYYESSSNSYYTSNDVIGDYMFYKCAKLQNIILPDNITSIGSAAFSGCSSLVSFEVPSNVTQIGGSAFSSCKSLTSIDIPNSVMSLGTYAFYNCSFTSIDIPEGITKIDEGTFMSCSSLTSIDIPDNIKTLGREAFWRCI